MKQMRSRFRLITLLLACAFLLTLVLCTGSALKSAGVTLDALSGLPGVNAILSPEPSAPPGEEPAPASPEPPADTSELPGTDNPPDSEYNIFGL